jgi:hypothetical protein
LTEAQQRFWEKIALVHEFAEDVRFGVAEAMDGRGSDSELAVRHGLVLVETN